MRQNRALVGWSAGIAVMVFVAWKLSVSFQWYVLIGSAVTFVVGYVASLAFLEQPLAAESTAN